MECSPQSHNDPLTTENNNLEDIKQQITHQNSLVNGDHKRKKYSSTSNANHLAPSSNESCSFKESDFGSKDTIDSDLEYD